ncbi:MAG: hypothetical protein QOJ64_2813 [Acidobacteriota bacterium]|jgi:TorA maturation chaperone TorD|nr:hypothetical protein [Acidobacteriota bacterium]
MELFRALAVLAESPTDESIRLADALDLGALPGADEYTQLFVFELYPYASVYLGPEGMLGGEARDRISGFWRALEQAPPVESDHLSVMLAFYARLIELEHASEGTPRESWRNTRRAFLCEHIISWLPIYLAKVAEIAPPFYKKWGDTLMAALLEEVSALGASHSLSIHLRERVGLIDPRTNQVDDFLQSILTPIRSGMIFTRADLTAAARRLGLSLRMGERKFILKALFAQDASALLAWLAKEADVWTKRHQSNLSTLGDVARAWEQRSSAAAMLLGELSTTANEVM